MFDAPEQKMIVQQAMQSGLPMPPGANAQEMQEMMTRPTWSEVNALLKDQALRQFRIDVETDSTIEPNETEEKQARVEFVTAIGQLLGSSLPFLQSAPQMAPLVGESVKFLARGFRVGREMEDVIETVFEQLQKNPPQVPGKPGQAGDPNAHAVAQTDLQATQIKAQSEGMKAQTAAQTAQITAQAAAIKAQADVQIAQIKAQSDAMTARLHQGDQQLQHNDQQLRLVALNRDPNPQAVSNG
jgi:hypothetical protein